MLIWELTVLPRTVCIQLQSRSETLESSGSWYRPLSHLIFTSTPPTPPPTLQTCQEARNHLTRPSTHARGYYEKVSAPNLLYSSAIAEPWGDEEKPASGPGPTPIPAPPSNARYIWVNFSIDMIDIGERRFLFSAHYASKIKRVRFKVRMSNRPILDILGRGRSKFGLPNVKDAEIEWAMYDWFLFAKRLARQPVVQADLVCRMEDIVCINRGGERMTLTEFEWFLTD